MSAGGSARKSTGRPSYYYRLLRRPRLQRQRSRSRSRTRPARESPQERPGSRRSLPGSLSEKNPSMEPSATTPFRVTVTISASPSPPGLGCHSATPRAPFLEPHGPGEHPASLVLGIRSLSCSPLCGSAWGPHGGPVL
ncbi:disabled homolog 2-interacting protein-like [Panthera uncia]|uniref:disabled homolog 2-interacting protein-like n=1 Tax=Panthera uncia TaxID=29064 RepID=UPI0020FF88CA|nr:disabled homolog 2-interacting protein-like [Panthera uncia]